MDDLQRLKEILSEVGAGRIWRPVYAPDDTLLSQGIGDRWDGLLEVLRKIDFSGKTVGDLGCNFGYYTFMVKDAGARHVLGIDSDERVIEGCEILKRLYNIQDVFFKTADIAALDGIGVFDMGMMIDLIGKEKVKSGIMTTYLDVIERMSAKEMIFTIRPRYTIKKHLNHDFQGLSDKYPGVYIDGAYFSMLDYIRDRFRENWEMSTLSTEKERGFEGKIALHFSRKP